ncbi:MAG TPA: YetF domain-containing protein [Thermoanaerobaculia bacterium]
MHEITAHLFNLPIPLLEKIIRPILVYAFLVILLRVFGKRELAQLNPFDLVVLLSLSNTVQNAIIGDDNSVSGGMIGAVTLLVTNYIVVRYLFRHRRLDQLMEGKPSILIKDGHMRKSEMAKELLTTAELQSVIRRQGFEGIHAIETCILEPGGAFSLKPKSPPADVLRHTELMQRLEALSAQVAAMEEKMARP